MRVEIWERTTGMGALHGTQLLRESGVWLFISELACTTPGLTYLGRRTGFNGWALEGQWITPADVRAYHRTNSGAVTTNPGHWAGVDGDVACITFADAH